MQGPGMDLDEREILVYDAYLILVARHRGGEQLLVHAGAVRALQVIEVDDGDLRLGISPYGAACNIDVRRRIAGQVVGLKPGQLFTIGRDKEVDDLRPCAVRDGDRKIVKTTDITWLASADRHVVVLRNVELGANQNFDAAIGRQVGRTL